MRQENRPFLPAISSMNNTMKFAKAAVSLFLLSRAATAWTTAARPSISRHLIATQFHSVAADSLTTEVVGKEKTESFRLAFKDGSTAISPWHDIPLKNKDGSYNMVSESDCRNICVSTSSYHLMERLLRRIPSYSAHTLLTTSISFSGR